MVIKEQFRTHLKQEVTFYVLQEKKRQGEMMEEKKKDEILKINNRE